MGILSSNITLKRLLCWIFLLQMVNIVIDPPDVIEDFEDGFAKSEVETIFELVAEQVFLMDIPDNEEYEEYAMMEDFNVEFSKESFDIKLKRLELTYIFLSPYVDTNLFITHLPEPNSPPPKFS